MSVPAGWNAEEALAALKPRRLRATVVRGHARRYSATDYGGSLRSTGRYNRGPDLFAPEETWPALYLAGDRAIALAELIRQLPSTGVIHARNRRLTRLAMRLIAVLDIRKVAVLGISAEALFHDKDWSVPQAVAAAARNRRVEGLLVPSAMRLGDNLIVFPDLLLPTSTLEVLDFEDPDLYREPR